MRYLIAIASCETEPWTMLEREGARKTWTNIPTDKNLHILFYYAKASKEHIINDRLYVNCEETALNQTEKAWQLFNHALSYPELEHIYLTNLSSYIRLDKIIERFQNAPKEKYYSGFIGQHMHIPFASGSGFFLSRDLIELIVKNKNQIITSEKMPSDVAYAELLMRYGIPIIPQPRLDLLDMGCLNWLKKEHLTDHFHFRCKQADRHGDCVIMQRIHSLLEY